jgi:hypothetical protein
MCIKNSSYASIGNTLTIDSLNASTSGLANQTVSSSTATGLNVTVNGYVITADYVSATATATCGSTSGNVQIQNLVINGAPVTITGAANQVIFFPTGGFVMINEQSTSKKIKAKNLNVTGLRIVFPNAADIRIASVRSEIKC